MVELYLRLVDRLLTPLLLMISVVLLLRGHNMPGGGFIASLLASAAIALQILSYGAVLVRNRVGRFLQPAIGIGLLIAVSSALFGLVSDGAFFRAAWWKATMLGREIEIGTPVLFDVGVFLTVWGATVSFLLGLSESVFVTPRIRLHLDRREPKEPMP